MTCLLQNAIITERHHQTLLREWGSHLLLQLLQNLQKLSDRLDRREVALLKTEASCEGLKTKDLSGSLPVLKFQKF